MQHRGHPEREPLRPPHPPQRRTRVRLQQPRVLRLVVRPQRPIQHVHVGHRQVQPLRPRRRHRVRRIPGQEQPAVLHRLTHERPELQHVLLEDRPLRHRRPRRRQPRTELRPDPVVGPVVHARLRVALEIQPLHARRPGRHQHEPPLRMRIDQLVRRRRRLRQDPEPGERVLPEEVAPLRDQVAAHRARPVRPDHEVALQRLLAALVGEPDRRLLGLDPVHRGVGHPEPDVAPVAQTLGDQVDEHLVLGVDRHRPPTRELGQVDPVQPALERQVDPVMDEPVAHQPVPQPGLPQQIHRALLQDPRLDRLLDRLPRLDVDHHRLHPRRCSRCDSNNPAGPAPTIPTWVRMAWVSSRL